MDSSLDHQQKTDEMGFVEVKVKDAVVLQQEHQQKEHSLLEHLSVGEMQKLCRQEEEKLMNVNKKDQWDHDAETEEQKRIAVELLNSKTKNSGQDATNDETDLLTQKVNEQNSESSHRNEFVKVANQLHPPENRTLVTSANEKPPLPSWLSKLDPEDQKEFLAAAGIS